MDPASARPPTGLAAGLAAAAAGLRLALTSPAVRRTYALMAGIAWALTTAMQVGGIWWLWHLTAPSEDTVGWLAWLTLWLLRIGGGVLVLIASPILALFAVNLAFPALAERIFLAALDRADPDLAADLRDRPTRSMLVSMRVSAGRLLRLVGVTALAVVIGLVPVAGGVVAPALQAHASAHLLAQELLDPYFDRAGLDDGATREVLRRTRRALLGFGLPYSLFLAIPLLGPAIFGLAQAAAATLVARVVDPQARAIRAPAARAVAQ